MKFENIRVYNFQNALRGMRNPLESWRSSDSHFGICRYQELKESARLFLLEKEWAKEEYAALGPVSAQYLLDNCVVNESTGREFVEYALLGPNDIRLAQKLIRAGSEHRKFLRQILVSVDITAPLYWWKEFDTYKVATVANSTSTMHKVASKPIDLSCFETDMKNSTLTEEEITDSFIKPLEWLRTKYLETKDKRYWKDLIRWLPSSWTQTRTVTFNYETLYAIANQRGHHKLTEWSIDFMRFIHRLPYSKELIFLN